MDLGAPSATATRLSKGVFLANPTSIAATLTASSRRSFLMFSLKTTRPALLNPRNTMNVIRRAMSTSTSVIPPLFFITGRAIPLPHLDPCLLDRDAVVVRLRRRGEPDGSRVRCNAVPIKGKVCRPAEKRSGDRMRHGHTRHLIVQTRFVIAVSVGGGIAILVGGIPVWHDVDEIEPVPLHRPPADVHQVGVKLLHFPLHPVLFVHPLEGAHAKNDKNSQDGERDHDLHQGEASAMSAVVRTGHRIPISPSCGESVLPAAAGRAGRALVQWAGPPRWSSFSVRLGSARRLPGRMPCRDSTVPRSPWKPASGLSPANTQS